jgi:hypothetical protein
MFKIDGNEISVTRGDIVHINVCASNQYGDPYYFSEGDIVRFKVFEKKNCEDVVLVKDTLITEETDSVYIYLDGNDTSIGDYISKPTDYWYEVELNPDTVPQTIIGYDEDGAKVFKLYPEGGTL